MPELIAQTLPEDFTWASCQLSGVVERRIAVAVSVKTMLKRVEELEVRKRTRYVLAKRLALSWSTTIESI